MNRHTDIVQATTNSAKGISHGVRGRNFRILIFVGTATLVLAFWFPLTTTERIIVSLLIGFMLSAELFNSAIEELCDVVTTEENPGIGRAKEMAAGAVMGLGITAIIIGTFIFIPYL